MISFFICFVILICGYLFYGKVVDQIFNPDDRETPAVAINDGIDYVVFPQWKLFMIQLLNILPVLARSSVHCLVQCGDLWCSSGSPLVPSSPVLCMTISQVCFPKEITVLPFPK